MSSCATLNRPLQRDRAAVSDYRQSLEAKIETPTYSSIPRRRSVLLGPGRVDRSGRRRRSPSGARSVGEVDRPELPVGELGFDLLQASAGEIGQSEKHEQPGAEVEQ